MTQGTGYIYSQRGDVVLGKRTGTTRNQPSNYKPFKLLKGVDTNITFFIRDVNGCKIQLHDKTVKAVITKHDGHAAVITKNLRITDVKNGVAVLHISPNELASLGTGFYNILLTYTDEFNHIHAMHSDANYRYCYVAEVIDDCGTMIMESNEVVADDFIYVEVTLLSIDITFYLISMSLFAIGSTTNTRSAAYYNTNYFIYNGAGCNAVFNIIKTSGGVYQVNFTNGGTGYSVGDIIIISGIFLGGTISNNLTITVTSVSPSGAITGATPTGTPYNYSTSYVTQNYPGPAQTTGGSTGLNTLSITHTNFQGSFTVQGTVSANPGPDDWFDICVIPGQTATRNVVNNEHTTVTEPFIFDGMFMFVRIKVTVIKGRVDKILYRS